MEIGHTLTFSRIYNILWETRIQSASDAADDKAILKENASDWPTSDTTLRSHKSTDRLSQSNKAFIFDVNTLYRDKTPRNLLQVMNRIRFVTDSLSVRLFVTFTRV